MNYVERNGVSVFVKVMSITNAKSSPICLSEPSCSSEAQSTFYGRQQESCKWPKAEQD